MKDKAEQLAHYATREPKSFLQIDLWRNGDGVVGHDENGQGMTFDMTTELMQGSDARILIPHDVPPREVAVLLRKAALWAESEYANNFAAEHPERQKSPIDALRVAIGLVYQQRFDRHEAVDHENEPAF